MSDFCFNLHSVFIVLISFLLNVGQEMSLPEFRTDMQFIVQLMHYERTSSVVLSKTDAP